MRVIEHQNDTKALPYWWLERVGIGATFFTALILLLMVGNFFALRRSDPIHAPALLKLTEELKANPQNETLKEQIRDLDYLARHAFFSSQRFQQLGVYLLAIGATAAVIAFRALHVYRRRKPYPAANPPKEDLMGNAQWARRAVSAAGLLLVGLALSLSLPWKSPLDQIGNSQPTEVKKSKVVPPDRGEFARNWPAFLGAASGHTVATDLPVTWDGKTGQGIAWKIEIPKPGLGTPIIWNNRLFLAGGNAERREVYCLDTETGAILWTHEATGIVGSPKQAPDVSEDTTMAASTMATDGSRVFAIFATGDLLALDFEGKRLWARNLGVPENPYGHGSSLVVSEKTLLVQFDQEKHSAFLGIETATGETRFKVDRSFNPSWATPMVMEHEGKRQAILAASPALVSYDLNSAAELWRVDCFQRSEVVPTPVFANGLIYVAGESAGLMAIDPVKRSIVWKIEESAPGVSTSLLVGELLFYGLSEGGLVCRNALTGQQLWESETDDGFYASPLLSEDRVYLVDRSGVTYIFSATNQFNLIGKPQLGEDAVTTPAVKGKSLYYRGKKHLFRIGS